MSNNYRYKPLKGNVKVSKRTLFIDETEGYLDKWERYPTESASEVLPRLEKGETAKYTIATARKDGKINAVDYCLYNRREVCDCIRTSILIGDFGNKFIIIVTNCSDGPIDMEIMYEVSYEE